MWLLVCMNVNTRIRDRDIERARGGFDGSCKMKVFRVLFRGIKYTGAGRSACVCEVYRLDRGEVSLWRKISGGWRYG